MKLNKIFYEKEYSIAYEFAIMNGFTIKEIEPDQNGRRFQIVEIPKPTTEDILNDLRTRRENECFSIINRGVLWYNTLTEEQRLELDKWYKEWLDITDKYVEGIDIETIIPKKPEWLK